MLNLYDGNNFYRRFLEQDPTGLAPRKIMTDMLASKDPCVWVWDAPDGSRKRRQFFNGYKRGRTAPSKDIYVGFDTAMEVLKFTPAIQVTVPGYEADDVIAALTRNYASLGEQVSIFSNDFDFVTLAGEYPNLIFTGARLPPEVPPHLVPYYKVTVGDNSDRIPGIGGFGKKTWIEVDKKALVAFIDALVHDKPLPDLDLPKRCTTWLGENAEQVKTFWHIVNFFEVPFDLISQHMTVGTPNYAAGDAYLKRWML